VVGLRFGFHPVSALNITRIRWHNGFKRARAQAFAATEEDWKRMDELITTLSEKTGLPEDKARTAADTVVNFIKSKLPESLQGQVDSALSGQGSSSSGSITDRLGGILGKKAA
jgi:hypothetical protein